jgi:colicin import membrane protein
MSAASLTLSRQHDALLPQPIGGTGPGAALALLVHLGLALALTTAVNWRTKDPRSSAPSCGPACRSRRAHANPPRWRRWRHRHPHRWRARSRRRPTPTSPSNRPGNARPKPTRNAPTNWPPRPNASAWPTRPPKTRSGWKTKRQRAEDEKKRVEEEKRKAEEDKKKRELEAAETKADEARLARQREENLRRMMGQAGGAAGNAGGTGTAARNRRTHGGLHRQADCPHPRQHLLHRQRAGQRHGRGGSACRARGHHHSRRLVKSSGFKEWDEAVLRAIDRTTPAARHRRPRARPADHRLQARLTACGAAAAPA